MQLGAATALVVLISWFLLTVFGLTFADSENTSWVEDLWQGLLRTLDTGTMAPTRVEARGRWR